MKTEHKVILGVGFGVVALVLLKRAKGGSMPTAKLSAPTKYTDNDVVALARALRSEVGSYTEPERLAVAFAIRQYARRKGKSIYDVSFPWDHQGGKHAWSTAQAETAKDTADAMRFLALPWSADPGGGAHKWFEPKLQDQLFAQRRPGYPNDAQAIREKWGKEGRRHTGTIGRIELWA